jgi:hypothetical protein
MKTTPNMKVQQFTLVKKKKNCSIISSVITFTINVEEE